MNFSWILSAGCGLNYHKRCVYKIPNNCNMRYNRRRSSSYLGVPRSPSESGSISSISALSDDSSVISPTIVGGLVSVEAYAIHKSSAIFYYIMVQKIMWLREYIYYMLDKNREEIIVRGNFLIDKVCLFVLIACTRRKMGYRTVDNGIWWADMVALLVTFSTKKLDDPDDVDVWELSVE